MPLIARFPDQRKIIVNVDGSQAEARVVARLCTALVGHATVFDDIFISGKKIHKVVASIIYNKPEDQIPKDNTPGAMYYVAKRAMHAYDNGMGPGKFAILTRLSVGEAERLLKVCAKKFPEVVEHFHPWCRNLVQTTRTMVNPYGRPHTFLDRLDDELFRRTYTYYQQSGIGDHVKLAFTDFYYDAKPEWEADLLLTTHDSITFQVLADPQTIWDAWILAKTLMERPMNILGRELVVPAEGTIGRSYQKQYGFRNIADIERLLYKLRYRNVPETAGLHQGLHVAHGGPGITSHIPLLDGAEFNLWSPPDECLDESGVLQTVSEPVRDFRGRFRKAAKVHRARVRS